MKLLGQSESKLASYCKYRLANGLTVIVAQRPHTQTFAMCLEVNAGMRDGSPHLAHLVEHLVIGNVLSGKNTNAEYINGVTHFTKTRYFLSDHLDKLDSGLELMSGVLSPLNVDKKTVKNEITILAHEFSESGIAQQIVAREHYRVLGGDKLAANYKSALNKPRLSIDADAVNAFHAATYRPSNATIAIVSPLEPRIVIEKIAGRFGRFEEVVGTSPEAKNGDLAEPRKRFYSSWRFGKATLCVWHKATMTDFSDRVALAFVGRMVLGGSSGRLFNELRVKNSLCYGVYDNLELVENAVVHNALVNVAPTKTRKAVQLLDQVIQSVTEPMLALNFEEKIVASARLKDMAEEDKWSLLVGLLNWSAGKSSVLITPHELKKATLELTPDRIAEVALRFFSVENRHWLLSGNFGPIGFFAAKRASAA